MSKGQQPKCPGCGGEHIVMQIRYKDVIAIVPIEKGKVNYDKLEYHGDRERCLKCVGCGREFAVGLTGEEFE